MAGATATAAIIGATASAAAAGSQIAAASQDDPAGGAFSSLTKKSFDPASETEGQLKRTAIDQYGKQIGLIDGGAGTLNQTQGLSDASINQQLGTINGQGFDLTPDEQARIMAQRSAFIQAGQGDIQNNLQENIGNVQQSAGVRGLRGQAVGELAGRATAGAGKDYANLVGQANATAAQQAVALPQQRLQIQNQAAQQGMTFAETLRQNAIANRQTAANPAILGNLTQERLAGSTTQNLVDNPASGHDYSPYVAYGVTPQGDLRSQLANSQRNYGVV